MIYILFVFLLFCTWVSYKSGGGRVNSPWFIVNLMFLISVSIYCIYFERMGSDISVLTLFVVVIGMTSWGIGDILSKGSPMLLRKSKTTNLSICDPYPYAIPNYFVLAIALIVVGVSVFTYFYFMEVGMALGGGNVFAAYGAVRYYMTETANGDMAYEFNKPPLLTLFDFFASVVSYYFLYCYLYNRIICNKKKLIYLLPIICYIPVFFFSTSRMVFLGLFSFIFAITSSLLYSISDKKSINTKVVKSVLPIIVIFAILFKVGGDIRGGIITEEGRTSDSSPIASDLCMYVASPINALNYFLINETNSEGVQHFGKNTLAGIRQILGRLGFTFREYPKHQKNVDYKTGTANVYTGIKSDIEDYYVIGAFLYMIFIGYICGFMYRMALLKGTQHSAIFFIVLGKLYYPIFIYFYVDDFYSLTGVDFLAPLFLLFLFNSHVNRRYISIKTYNDKCEI